MRLYDIFYDIFYDIYYVILGVILSVIVTKIWLSDKNLECKNKFFYKNRTFSTTFNCERGEFTIALHNNKNKDKHFCLS